MPGGGFTPTYRCSNPYCPEAFHFYRGCPNPAVPRRVLEEELENRAELRRLRYEAALARPRPRPQPSEPPKPVRPDPGHAWLLVFIPVALLVGGVMFALMFL
jgi:hypothetical protein